MVVAFAFVTAPCCLALAQAPAVTVREETIFSNGRLVSLQAHLSSKPSPRPAVVLLHGKGGITPFAKGYDRYADALAQAGIDAYLFSYYDEMDTIIMKSADRKAREQRFGRRIGEWAHMVNEVVSALQALPEPPTRVGLLGFSNGGYLAVGAAGLNERISAVAVMYGGMPEALQSQLTRLPRMLVMHGAADRAIPASEGRKLVALARQLGTMTEFVIYPGEGHGFDLGVENPDGVDARRRVVSFFSSALGGQ